MKLINADELLEELNGLADAEHGQWTRFNDEAAFGAMNAFCKTISIVKHMNPAEPEIVHCKDCVSMEYDSLFNQYWCNGHIVSTDFYCAKGERKANGTTTT